MEGKNPAEVDAAVERARWSLVPKRFSFVIREFGVEAPLEVVREGVGPLKTDAGVFHHFLFSVNDKWKKYSALVAADLSDEFSPIFKNPNELLLRIDSGCETGQLFGDRTCECREQLGLALAEIAKRGEGVVVNVPFQDGRGLGLPFKLATLFLQDALDVHTVKASALLDPDGDRDVRTYSGVLGVMLALSVPKTTKILLATNNPKKAEIFSENGYVAPEFHPIVVPATDLTREHLKAKQEELGHIDLVSEED